MKSEFVFIDFDGTIVDSYNMCYNITKKALPGETELSYHSRFAGDINKTLSEIKSKGIDFFTEYESLITAQPLVPGITDAIASISANFSLIIVSSSPSRPIKKYLARRRLTSHFDAVLGNDTPSTKAIKLQLLLNHYKLKPADTALVTDTLGDVRDANSVEVPAIAVTWGYDNASTLQQGDPACIIDFPTQLKGAIEEVLEFSDEYEERH